jgi:hypothetical protein
VERRRFRGSRKGGPPAQSAAPASQVAAPAPDPKQNQQCLSAFQNSSAGQVVKFGSLLSFVDDALGTAKVWGEAMITKYSYFRIAEMAGQSLRFGGSITPVTTVAKPLIGRAATAGVAAATVADLMVRGTCSMAANPDMANAALRAIP